MNPDLLSKLAECWPADSRFEARFEHDMLKLDTGSYKNAYSICATAHDASNAPACVVIEDELIRLGRELVCAGVIPLREARFEYSAEMNGVKHRSSFWTTRTEALVTVAIAVFESIANKKSPPG